jgi:hypothetical protein
VCESLSWKSPTTIHSAATHAERTTDADTGDANACQSPWGSSTTNWRYNIDGLAFRSAVDPMALHTARPS